METFGDGGGVDQVATADATNQVTVDVFHRHLCANKSTITSLEMVTSSLSLSLSLPTMSLKPTHLLLAFK